METMQHKKKAKPSGISEKVIRLLDIYTSIAQSRYPSVSALQDRFSISKRTVHRYLEMIDMIDPITLDKGRNGYAFVHGDRIKKMILSESDFLLLVTLGDAVCHLGDTFRDTFQGFANRLTTVAKEVGGKDHLPIAVRIPDAFVSDDLGDYFRTIFACIQERRSIDMNYRTRGKKDTTERRVDPYGLVFHDGSWILIGYCHLREEIRRFALDRIVELKETWRNYRQPEGFSLDEHLSHSWGIHDGEKVDITVRFPAEIADLILRKKKWHPSEQRKILDNGDVSLSFTVTGTREIKKWVYSWLPYAVVTEPDWLRQEINRELSISAKNHK